MISYSILCKLADIHKTAVNEFLNFKFFGQPAKLQKLRYKTA